jgi:hypothetical protein
MRPSVLKSNQRTRPASSGVIRERKIRLFVGSHNTIIAFGQRGMSNPVSHFNNVTPPRPMTPTAN